MDSEYIDRWYDRSVSSWVVQLKDEEGNDLAPAIYAYTKQEAAQVVANDFERYDSTNKD